MISLGMLNVILAVFLGWGYNVTLMRLARLLRGPNTDFLNADQVKGLEWLEQQYGLSVLLSPRIRFWYTLNRVFLIVASYFFIVAGIWIIKD